MARKKNGNGFDVAKASSNDLADMGGACDSIIKRNGILIEEIKIELRERAGNLPNDEKMNIVGADYTVDVGKVPSKVNMKALDNKEIIEMIGQDTFNLMSNFPVGQLKTVLSGKDYDALIGEPDEGTRTVSFKERS